MLKKSCAILMSALMLGMAAPLPVLAEVKVPVKTVTRSEHKVEVECPQVVGGNAAATEKINSALSSQAASYVSEASTLGGGKVHYDVHKADDKVISLTLVMTPNTGVEETQGMTFDRKTGDQKPLSFYYGKTELAQRAENGLRYLYDVDEEKLQILPDTYYVDKDGSIIGLYHAGTVLDRGEGEIEINLSAADVEDSTSVYSSEEIEDNTTANTAEEDTEQEAKEKVKEKAAKDKEEAQAKIKAMRERAKKAEEEKAAWNKAQAEKEAAEKAAAEKAAKEKAEKEKAAKAAAEKTTAQPKESMKERVAEYKAREKARREAEAKREAEEQAALKKAQEEARKAAEAKARQEAEAREAAEAERQAKEAALAAEQAEKAKAEESGQWVDGVITGTEVRIRNSAGTDTNVLGYFEKGETVKVMGSDVANGRKWYRVQRADGSRGWVAADYCRVGEGAGAGDEGNARTGTITGTDVRVRGSASLSGDILDYYQEGETVSILNEVTADGMRWFKVTRSNGETGWVAAQYCNVE